MSGTPSALAEPAALSGQLGTRDIVFMVLAGAAPLTAISAVIPFILVLSGNTAGAVYFIASALLLALFAVGYMLMTKHIPRPGAMYAYVTAGLGRIIGSGSAMLAVGSYFANMLALYIYGGYLTAQTITTFSGWSSPWWIWALVMFALVAVLGFVNVDVSARVLGVVLVAETIIVLVLDIAITIRGGQSGLTAAPLNPLAATHGAPGLGLMFAFLAFVGFEATAIYRSEARDPNRTIPRATYIAVFGIGLFYAFSTWALTVGAGMDKAVKAAGASPTTFVFDLATRYVSPILSDVMQVLLVSSVFACVLSLHNVISRYALSMSEQRLLPALIGRINPRHGAPSNASAALSGVTVLAIGIVLASRIDPINTAYPTLAGCIGYGIIILMVLTSIAVIVYFVRHTERFGLWPSMIAPGLAAILLGITGVISFQNIDLLTGNTIRSVIVSGYLLALFATGVVVAAVRREPPSTEHRGPRDDQARSASAQVEAASSVA